MRKSLLLILFFPFLSYSQDTLVDKKGNQIIIEVVELKKGKIFYKNYQLKKVQSDTIHSLSKKDYAKLTYVNGKEIVFDNLSIFKIEDNKQKILYNKLGIDYWKSLVRIGDTVKVEILHQPFLASKGEVIAIKEDDMVIRVYQSNFIKQINGKEYVDKVIQYKHIKSIYKLSFYLKYK